jgi:hypothetical protein
MNFASKAGAKVIKLCFPANKFTKYLKEKLLLAFNSLRIKDFFNVK